jgi:hypothetical protein
MELETKNILTSEVLAVLRAMIGTDMATPAASLAKTFSPIVTGILNQIHRDAPLSDELVYPHVLSAVNGLRVVPEGVSSSGTDFDATWLDRVDKSRWLRWENLKKYLLEYLSPIRTPEDINSLDVCSDDVIRWAGPAALAVKRRGLVLGYVQSGKTQNFTALIAKAADCGYKLVIVLSGVDDEIRRQTQSRINRDIIGAAEGFSGAGVAFPSPRWEYFTDEENDFGNPRKRARDVLSADSPCCLVVKKNSRVLDNLIAWLVNAGDLLERTPVLIIDDEADQASPSTARNEYDPTRINACIRSIIMLFHNCKYVAYTATPFANFFINSRSRSDEFGADLFPSDFIRSLPLPKGYFGTADIYGLPSGVLRDGIEVLPAGICRLTNDSPDQFGDIDEANVPAGLSRAVKAYYISTSLLILKKGDFDIPASMLVHVSHLNDDHEDNRNAVTAAVRQLRAAVISMHQKDALRLDLEKMYQGDYLDHETQFKESMPDVSVSFPSFDDVWTVIVKLLQDGHVEIRVVNGQEGAAPDFEGINSPDRYIKVILVGGNLLSRGLTIKNLLVSYFLRDPGQADTMLQMARWLGYRRNYAYLMRVFCSEQCHRDMEAIAGAEQDVRNQIAEMNYLGKSPAEFAIRVRIREGLLPTRRNAMRTVGTSLLSDNLGAQLRESREFPEDNLQNLFSQHDANKASLGHLLASVQPEQVEQSGWYRYRINSHAAVAFMESLQISDNEWPTGNSDITGKTLLLNYIRARVAKNELSQWEVLLCGLRHKSTFEPVEIVPGVLVNPIERGRELMGAQRMSRISNLSEGKDEYTAASESERAAAASAQPKPVGVSNGKGYRQLRSPDLGRIFVYPISKFSNQPALGGGKRVPLFQLQDLDQIPDFLMAFGISLPGSPGAYEESLQEYINETVGRQGTEPTSRS